MQYTVLWGRKKSISIRVTDEGEVQVTAPKGTDRAQIDGVVSRHKRWINARLREKSFPTFSYQVGEQVILFGKSYRIAVGRTGIEENILYLPESNREGALKRLLMRLTEQIMGELTARIAAYYGFTYARVRASSARGRWGSCNKDGVIAYTFRLSLLPLSLCEYVALHELCHTRYMNHSKSFWNEVAAVMPDWKKRRKLLHEQSGAMNALPF